MDLDKSETKHNFYYNITKNTMDDYFTDDIATLVFTPKTFDAHIVIDEDDKHSKGYFMM